MTSSQTVSITCPQCGNADEVEVWTSINNVENPDEAQWLIDGFLFRFECPVCGNVSVLNHDCVYHDANRKALVMYAADRTRAQNAQAALEERAPVGYLVRAVHTPDELREKAAILRDGLDDRAVEVAKLAAYNRFVEEGKVTPDVRTLYGAIDEDEGIIVEFVSPTGSYETTVPRELYERIADSFTDQQPTVVDRAWASQVLAKWD